MVYLSLSVFISGFFPLHYTSLNIITPSIPSLCCLIIYLALLSTCQSSTLFSCCSFSLSLSYSLFSISPHFFLSAALHPPPLLLLLSNQIVSAQPSPLIKGVLQPRRKHRRNGSLLPLSLCRGGWTGDNSEPTSISISGTAQRPARPPPPPHPPANLYHISLPAIFPGGERKPGRGMGRSWEHAWRRRMRERDDLDLV